MKTKIIFLSIFLLFVKSYSQSNFKKGFIVKKNDTIYGYIDDKSAKKSYKNCAFRQVLNTKTTHYKPNDLSSYGFINGKHYTSKAIKNEESNIETVFLEILVRGKATLYKYDASFFIEKENSKLLKLSKKSKKNKKTKRYRGQLSFLLSDCKNIKEKLLKFSLNERNITQLIVEYNTCVGAESIAYKEKIPWFKMTTRVSTGYLISKLNINTEGDPILQHLASKFEPESSIIGGVTFDFSRPRVSNRISFNLGLFYVKNKYTTSNTVLHESFFEENYITVDLEELKIPLGFTYTIPKKNIAPYVSTGITVNFPVSSNINWLKYNIYNNNDVTTNDKNGLAFDKIQYGFWGAIGINKKIMKTIELFLECRTSITFAKVYGRGNPNVNAIQSQPFDYSFYNYFFLLGINF